MRKWGALFKPPLVFDINGHLQISLPTGIVRLDYEDGHLVADRAVHAARMHAGVPYVTVSYEGRQCRLHRIIVGAEGRQVVDHINGDTLDNRRSNLRLATQSQNAANAKLAATNTTGFRGVCKPRPNGKSWIAQIGFNGKNLYLGGFQTAEAAARAYDAKAVDLFGEFACVNFPGENQKGIRGQ